MDFSTLPLEGFAPRDKKIIKDNPGKTLAELAESGISDKAYERLGQLEQESKKQIAEQLKQQAIQPKKVEPTIVKTAQSPSRLSKNNVGSTSVWLYNQNTGLRQYLSRQAAEKLVRMNPKVYKIVG